MLAIIRKRFRFRVTPTLGHEGATTHDVAPSPEPQHIPDGVQHDPLFHDAVKDRSIQPIQVLDTSATPQDQKKPGRKPKAKEDAPAAQTDASDNGNSEDATE